MWHRPLRHPSNLMIKNFLGKSSLVKNKLNKNCVVYLHAKQTRKSFPLSQNNAANPFDLIYCDLWGPYNTAFTCGALYFLTIIDKFSRSI